MAPHHTSQQQHDVMRVWEKICKTQSASIQLFRFVDGATWKESEKWEENAKIIDFIGSILFFATAAELERKTFDFDGCCVKANTTIKSSTMSSTYKLRFSRLHFPLFSFQWTHSHSHDDAIAIRNTHRTAYIGHMMCAHVSVSGLKLHPTTHVGHLCSIYTRTMTPIHTIFTVFGLELLQHWLRHEIHSHCVHRTYSELQSRMGTCANSDCICFSSLMSPEVTYIHIFRKNFTFTYG